MPILPSPREALANLASFMRAKGPVPPPPPHEDPRAIIARPYAKSVLHQILDAPNLATAEHIHKGAVGGARDVSSGTRRKWDRALEGVRRREAEAQA